MARQPRSGGARRAFSGGTRAVGGQVGSSTSTEKRVPRLGPRRSIPTYHVHRLSAHCEPEASLGESASAPTGDVSTIAETMPFPLSRAATAFWFVAIDSHRIVGRGGRQADKIGRLRPTELTVVPPGLILPARCARGTPRASGSRLRPSESRPRRAG